MDLYRVADGKNAVVKESGEGADKATINVLDILTNKVMEFCKSNFKAIFASRTEHNAALSEADKNVKMLQRNID
jgi:hypothetical protein